MYFSSSERWLVASQTVKVWKKFSEKNTLEKTVPGTQVVAKKGPTLISMVGEYFVQVILNIFETF